jgi:hypothetical protein
MALIHFVRNHGDLSTEDGFQFVFFCDRCGSGYQSRFQASRAGFASGALQTASSLLNALNGVAEVEERVRPPTRKKAHDEAFARAVEEMMPRFRECRRCGQWVDVACWNAARRLCLDCTPDRE